MDPTPAKELSDAQLADEFAETRLRMMAWRPNVNPDAQRFTELSTELLARQIGKPADQQILVEGEKWKVPITPQEQKTTITDRMAVYRVIRKLGVETVVETYTITLAAIRKLLTQKQQAKLLKTERTGNREIREPVLKEAR